MKNLLTAGAVSAKLAPGVVAQAKEKAHNKAKRHKEKGAK